jgi:phage terminase large subunit GpA-like protein
MMAISPTVEMALRNSKQRIAPLVEETPELAARVRSPRSRDSGNTVQSKEFPGGILVMTGANSAVGLRSMPARYLFLDEIDAYPGDVGDEGDPVELAEARTRTFGHRKKIYLASTPTVKGASRIEAAYDASDQRKFFVPCPHCGHTQHLQFERLRWEDEKPETVLYYCEGCGTGIEEYHKTAMLTAGEWRPTAQGPAGVAGFHLSSLYSPVGWLSWADIARMKLNAKGSQEREKVFKNTVLAETWQESGEAPDWRRLYERREDYPVGTVPAGGLILTAGVDRQDDRLEVSIWAWGRNLESWLVQHRVFHGDTGRPEVWAELEKFLQGGWDHETGARLTCRLAFVDSGDEAQAVYRWVRTQNADRVKAVKGRDSAPALVQAGAAYDVTLSGQTIKNAGRLFIVNGGMAKRELYAALRRDAPTDEEIEAGNGFPAGYVHLPKVEQEYCEQLCSERLVFRRNRNGFTKTEWERLRRNEALDCRVYARAAAALLYVDQFRDQEWERLEAGLVPAQHRPAKPKTPRRNRMVDY